MAKNKYGTNFLDYDRLYREYQPIINSTYAKFSKWVNLYHSHTDYEDLKAQVDAEFMRLCAEYDPSRGVDFAGYIYFHLNQRVYHQVTKFQKRQSKETTSPTKQTNEEEASVDFDNIHDPVDYDNERQIDRVEALASLDWKALPDESHQRIARYILYDRKTLQEVADAEGVPQETIRSKLNLICEKLRQWSQYKDAYQTWKLNHPDDDFDRYVEIRKMHHIAIKDIREPIEFYHPVTRRSWRWKKAVQRPILQFDLQGRFVKEWASAADAARGGYNASVIGRVCMGRQKEHKGYKWYFKDQYESGGTTNESVPSGA